jgi:hypothetical protein
VSKNEQCRVVKYLVRRHFGALHLSESPAERFESNTCHTVDQQALTRAFVKLILFIWSRSTIGRVERDERIGMPDSPCAPCVPRQLSDQDQNAHNAPEITLTTPGA